MSKEILELYRKLNCVNKKKLIKEMDYLLIEQNKNVIIELKGSKKID